MTVANQLKRALHDGRPAAGLLVSADAPWLVDLIGLSGWDFVLFDCEHGPIDGRALEGMLRAADAASLTSLVRVSHNSAPEILQALDLGAQGIVVPSVMTATAAEMAVDACRYPPQGRRGLALVTRAARYGAQSPAEHMAAANAAVQVIPIIEDPQGVSNAAAIVATPGIDMILIGPGDLSAAMGHGGDGTHPAVHAAVAKVAAASRKAGLPVMLPAGSPEAAAAAVRDGASAILVSASRWIFQSSRALVTDIQKAMTP